MTPEGTVIHSGLGPSLLTLVLFACGLCPDLFGAVLVPDIADRGAVAIIGVEFMKCTDGVRWDAYPTRYLDVPRAGQPFSHGVHQ